MCRLAEAIALGEQAELANMYGLSDDNAYRASGLPPQYVVEKTVAPMRRGGMRGSIVVDAAVDYARQCAIAANLIENRLADEGGAVLQGRAGRR